MKIRWTFFPVIFAILLLPLFPPDASAESFGAEIADLSGTVNVTAKAGAVKVAASKGLKLAPGDMVETAKGGEAEIMYDDGNLTRLDENSRMTIERLAMVEGGGRETVLKLEMGQIKNAVSKLVNKRSKFEVHTKSAVAGVTGTPPWVVGLAGKLENPSTEVDLLGDAGEPGEVFVEGKGGLGRQVLNSGTRSVVPPGSPPLSPFKISSDRMEMLKHKMQFKTPEGLRKQKRQDLDKKSGVEQPSEKAPEQPKEASAPTPPAPAPIPAPMPAPIPVPVPVPAPDLTGAAAAGAAGLAAGVGVAAGTAIAKAPAALIGGGSKEKEEKPAPVIVAPVKQEEQKPQPPPVVAQVAEKPATPPPAPAVTAVARPQTAAVARLQFTGGARHSIYLKADGSVWTWGYNNQGELGDGTDDERLIPVRVKGPGGQGKLTSILSVAAGAFHTLAVKADGTVWTWGYNDDYQLGDGTDDDRLSPVVVKGPGGKGTLGNAVAVAGGERHTLALKADGTVWAWGYNDDGQLGDDSDDDRKTPVQVKGPGAQGELDGIVAIAAGASHSIALKNDGTVWAWGKNTQGQLGDGTAEDHETPVIVKNLEGIIAIAAGANHCVALKNDGTVYTWGKNDAGQLGDKSVANQLAPVPVKVLSGITAIAAGSAHSVALKNDGTVWTWGNNFSGQLGISQGVNTIRTVPVFVDGLLHVAAIAAGGEHTLAIKSDGTLWSWGKNDNGQLGDGTDDGRPLPVQVSGM
ncbi:MAG: FecR domain-containing protein [Nitrospinae bacterium]|nr:FecR domain-containing protein [Nitrospinota bacterium]